MKYKSYHTSLKILCNKGTLPNNYLDEINRSTIWRWKQEKEGKYTGTELSEIKILENFINRKEAQQIMRTYMKTALIIKTVITACKSFQTSIKENTSKLVATILRYKGNIDYKILLRLLNIPLSVFYYWANKMSNKCSNSPILLCKKTYPNQLTKPEVVKMKELLLSEKFTYWPVCSIAYHALRENMLNISLGTWYKYIKLLGIKRPGVPKKAKYPKGIKASFPNEYWHADITIVKSLDGVKNYVYLLMDNFSKYIINWCVEPIVSGNIRLQTIRDAYESITGNQDEVKLVIDGGPENNNNAVDGYTNSQEINIIKLIALKDIPFSNSLVEAQNKLLKYRYLFKQQVMSITDLRKKLEWIIDDYNNHRPHISLNGLTPFEAYNGKAINKNQINEQIKQAKADRLAENREGLCEPCQ